MRGSKHWALVATSSMGEAESCHLFLDIGDVPSLWFFAKVWCGPAIDTCWARTLGDIVSLYAILFRNQNLNEEWPAKIIEMNYETFEDASTDNCSQSLKWWDIITKGKDNRWKICIFRWGRRHRSQDFSITFQCSNNCRRSGRSPRPCHRAACKRHTPQNGILVQCNRHYILSCCNKFLPAVIGRGNIERDLNRGQMWQSSVLKSDQITAILILFSLINEWATHIHMTEMWPRREP